MTANNELPNVHGSRVGIVGGSIAGCALAIALDRLGCDVTILERSSSGLQDRGSGIAIPPPLRDELIQAGYLPADYPTWRGSGRHWYIADGSHEGRLAWRQPGEVTTNNWGSLWRGLRSKLPSTVDYRDGSAVTALIANDKAVAVTVDGSTIDFDVVFGADGYRSLVRGHVHPNSTPTYAGYVLWRGNFPAEELSDRQAWDEVCATNEWITVAFEGGHGIMYPIPDFEAARTGRLRVNWAIYAPTPSALTLHGPSSIAPGMVDDACYAQYQALLDETMPPKFRPLFQVPQDQLSIQPIYDEMVDRYTAGRLALIGDAATLTRPHTGSGATKAIQDALLIEELGATHHNWASLLDAYDTDRSAEGARLVDVGRRIGCDQVERTPPWADMTPADFAAWAAGTLGDDKLYFWGSDETEPTESANVRAGGR